MPYLLVWDSLGPAADTNGFQGTFPLERGTKMALLLMKDANNKTYGWLCTWGGESKIARSQKEALTRFTCASQMKQKKELNYVGADASAFINVDQFISLDLTNRLSNTPPRQIGEKGKSGASPSSSTCSF